MAKRQNFVVGSTSSNVEVQTDAQLNHAWDSTVVLHSNKLNGVFNAVSDYSNDSSNEIANAVLKLSGSQPTGASQTELGDAIDAKINLAATSGTMILDEGVWYAKMLAATVAPAAEDGTNYADFSQTDQDNNPIIVVYERQSGAWVQTQTVIPPADYDGYVLVTSKIWDIAEQAGQQGGRIMWNHTAKTFTPYPQIIAFHDIAVTGDSTVAMPVNPGPTQIVNKNYVDNFAGYHPALFSHEWDDHLRSDMSWLRADTFSWQDGGVYEAAYDHLVDDIDGKTLQSETIAGTTVQFYLADDGHKICPDTQESNVAAIYTATGVAWYYIIDTANQRFKLPRDNSQNKRVLIKDIKSGTKWARVYSDGWVEQGGPDNTPNKTINLLITMADTNYTVTCGFSIANQGAQYVTKATTSFTTTSDAHTSGTNGGWLVAGYANTTYLKNVVSQFEAQYKYLYFYVGNFTQSAVENTAGLNAELFNDKADINAQNFDATGKAYLAGLGMPSATYTDLTLGASGASYTAPVSGWVVFRSDDRPDATARYVYFYGRVNTGDDNTGGTAGTDIMWFAPVAKGSTFSIYHNLPAIAAGETRLFRIYHAKGAV